MAFLLLSMVLVAATVFVVRPAVASGPRIGLAHFDGRGVLVVFVIVVAASLVVGLGFAVALLLAALVKELGHVLGHRLAGHADAQFRLLPLPGGPPISARAPSSDLAAFFILLMGPVFGLAPMIAAFALGAALAPTAPAFAEAARAYALAAGALNFVALLPLWPLPGGRLTRMVVEARFPRVGGLAAATLSAFTIGLAITWSSALLFLLGLVGGLALVVRPTGTRARPPLAASDLRIAFTAYFATLAAYFLGGWWVLKLLPLLG